MIRNLAIILLEDEHGISIEAWETLCPLMDQHGEDYEDLENVIKVSGGRVYLREGHGRS